MRFRLLLLLITTVTSGVIWLSFGRCITLIVDRFITVRVASTPVVSLVYDGGGLLVNEPSRGLYAREISMTFGSIDNQGLICACAPITPIWLP